MAAARLEGANSVVANPASGNLTKRGVRAGIKKGAELGTISNTDVAPTVARLLGLSIPKADGRVLAGALRE